MFTPNHKMSSRWNRPSEHGPCLLEVESTDDLPTLRRPRGKAFLEVLHEKFDSDHIFKQRWKVSDSDSGNLSSCRWSHNNVKLCRYGLSLSITPREQTGFLTSLFGSTVVLASAADKPYRGGKVSLLTDYTSGTYEAELHPMRLPGIVTSFLLRGTGDQEIAVIEFVGDDPTKAQIGHTSSDDYYMYNTIDIPVTKDGWYTATVKWDSTTITWHLNGEYIHQTTSEIPRGPLHPMFCLWNVSSTVTAAVQWAGEFNYTGKKVTSWIRNCRVIL